MTNLQIHDITWKRDRENYFYPIIKFFDNKLKTFNPVKLENYEFKFNLTEQRYCTGYYQDGKHYECKFNNILESKTSSQCGFCEKVQGFKSSFIFGDITHERSAEILSQEYYIYLAYFEPGIIKVGTAQVNRGNKRLIEQDCLLYSFIAKGTGYQIQKFEHLISKKLKITETVKSNHKFKFLSQVPNIKKATELFEQNFNRIKSAFESDYEYSDLLFPQIQIENLTLTNNLYFPEKYKKIEDLNLFGIFKGLRGRYLFIDNIEIAAFDINNLIGRYIESYIDNYEYNFFEEQLNLL